MADFEPGRHLASTVLAATDTDTHTYGVVRILNSSAGTPGEEREFKTGDEALVEAGLAEWVVAPVFEPAAGRRLDTDAEREPTPRGGIEAYPPAEPTTSDRRVKARDKGYVDAHTDDGLGEKLAARRFEVARDLDVDGEGPEDAKTQAELGGLGARSGPVTKPSDLAADKALREATVASDEKTADQQSPQAGVPGPRPVRK